ncbi:hypothetical protein PILCRDRAFT_681431 [Piloderma croceum F 1598]|uniref:HNH nuclease domain-containing protein n=1 Tax=Piloderma croceum (strain F 1598) TaxID=765440 RepID=A0A0C3F613_PILCF|nr:hypothetical protein PILCRDRAFT_681431 [Piloderma croceum F 1598]
MVVYAATANESFVHRDSRNLFALRWDIYTFQFDSGNLVIVPINGQMVAHFIGASCESAALYHNKPFDSSHLSHEFLFAQFAWAIIKRAHVIFMAQSRADRRAFNLKAAPLDEKEEAMGSDNGDGDELIGPQLPFVSCNKHRSSCPEATPLFLHITPAYIPLPEDTLSTCFQRYGAVYRRGCVSLPFPPHYIFINYYLVSTCNANIRFFVGTSQQPPYSTFVHPCFFHSSHPESHHNT